MTERATPPAALDGAGTERVETGLAGHIVQLAGEAPSHIVWPAMHKRREEVEQLFKARRAEPPQTGDIPSLVASVRRELHNKFLPPDAGTTGANFLIADIGAVCTVTNEGNAEPTTTPPRIRIVTAGIEKLVPSHRACLRADPGSRATGGMRNSVRAALLIACGIVFKGGERQFIVDGYK